MGRTVSALLTELERNTAERLRRKIGSILTFGDAPFSATAQIALEAITVETGATAAELTIYYEPDAGPVLSVQWGTAPGEATFVEAGTTTIASDRIALGAAAGSGVTAVLSLQRGRRFRAGSGTPRERGDDHVRDLDFGALLRPNEMRTPSETEYASEFVTRLRGQVDGRVVSKSAAQSPSCCPMSRTRPVLSSTMSSRSSRIRCVHRTSSRSWRQSGPGCCFRKPAAMWQRRLSGACSKPPEEWA